MEQFEMLAKWANNNMDTYIFYLLAIIAIPLAYRVLLDRTIIRSGFMLIGVFSSICGLFLLLEAQFLALAQLMIYAVAITLVVVIALMLTNPRLGQEESAESTPQQVSGFFAAIFMFLTIYLALRSESWPVNNSAPMLADNVQTIGIALTTTYSLPFEFSSVLLLAALVGAILIAKTDKAAKLPRNFEEFDPGITRRATPPLVEVGSGNKSE
jgi:NADH:ubiquinone oxidoreductase subunit 6 (subunit J)